MAGVATWDDVSLERLERFLDPRPRPRENLPSKTDIICGSDPNWHPGREGYGATPAALAECRTCRVREVEVRDNEGDVYAVSLDEPVDLIPDTETVLFVCPECGRVPDAAEGRLAGSIGKPDPDRLGRSASKVTKPADPLISPYVADEAKAEIRRAKEKAAQRAWEVRPPGPGSRLVSIEDAVPARGEKAAKGANAAKVAKTLASTNRACRSATRRPSADWVAPADRGDDGRVEPSTS